MKLKSFIAESVYNQFDFDIDFFSDVTILHGINGCGKTTVLKLLNSIIGGKFYDLNDFIFKEIKLTYQDEGKEKSITITKENQEGNVNIVTNDERLTKTLNSFDFSKPLKSKTKNKKYQSILDDFKKIFNAIFLSIERKVQQTLPYDILEDPYFRDYIEDFYEMGDFRKIPVKEIERIYKIYRSDYMLRRRSKRYKNEVPLYYDPINVVNDLISKEYQRYQRYCSGLDKQYQQESYEKMVSLKNIDEIKNKMLEFNKDEMVESKEKIFNQITYFKQKFQIPEEEDFKYLIEHFETEHNKITNGKDISSQYLLNFIQFLKLDELASILELNNKWKEEKYTPFQTLIDILNDFFSVTKKEALFEDDSIKFKIINGELIGAHELSSGEKQILIFFTHLIFSEHNDIEPIILYDEPDLSLHLDWQEKFIDSVLKINPTIQMILATHSPGIGAGKFQTHSKSLENSFIAE